MARIPIERTESGRGWLWGPVAAAVVSLLLWWLFAGRDDRVATGGEIAPPVASITPPPASASVPNAVAGSPVDTFLTWAAQNSAQRDASIDHDYVSAGITRLAAAIAGLAAVDSLGGSSEADQLQALNRLAEQVRQDPRSTDHADIVHAAFQSSAALLGDIQQRRFPAAATAVGDVRSAADAIAKDRPLLDQKMQMDRFFKQAAAAVRAMSTR